MAGAASERTFPIRLARITLKAIQGAGLTAQATGAGGGRPSDGGAVLLPDYYLVAVLITGTEASKPMLFEVPFGQRPRKLAEGDEAGLMFGEIVSSGLPSKAMRQD